MVYWIPSSVQKRLLRYALSRLELLETDALDLDRLDIGWGRRSSVELRDVGLRRTKLASLLRLPQTIHITTATVSLVKVTVPADLLTSSIVVEVHGVKADVVLQEQDQAYDKTRPAKEASSRDRPARRARHRRASFRNTTSFDDDDHVPTPRDLAESFLQAEPDEEREQLEAALASQSVDLRQSVASSNSSEDEQSGTGVGVTLPSFLAAFFKGISDRLEVVVKDVFVKLNVEAQAPADQSFGALGGSAGTPVSLCLQVDEVKVDEVCRSTAETLGNRDKEAKSGKRHVKLLRVRGSLLSDPTLFAKLSRMAEPDTAAREAQAAVTESVITEEQPSDHSYWGFEDGKDAWHSTRSSSAPDNSRGDGSLGKPDFLGNSQYLERSVLEDSSSVGPNDYYSRGVESSRRLDSVESSRRLDSVESSRHSDSDALHGNEPMSIYGSLTSFRQERRPSLRYSRKGPFDSRSASTSPDRRSSESRETGTRGHDTPRLDVGSDDGNTRALAESCLLGNPDAATSLAQSRSEVEESVYMSVVGDALEKSFNIPHIPGQWDESSEHGELANTDTQSLKSLGLDGKDDDHVRSAAGSVQSQTGATLYKRRVAGEEAAASTEKPPVPFVKSSSSHIEVEQMIGKHFFLFDQADIWMSDDDPQDHEEVSRNDQSKTTLAHSTTTRSQPQLPGSFSSYAEASAASRLRQSQYSSKDSGFPNASTFLPTAQSKGEVEILVDTTRVCMDVSTIRLLSQTARVLQSAFPSSGQAQEEVSKRAEQRQSLPSKVGSGLRFTSEKLALDFSENIENKNIFQPFSASTHEDSETPPPLFSLKTENVDLLANDVTSWDSLALGVGRITLNLFDNKILEFSQQARMRTSVRDLQEDKGKDVTVKYHKVKGAPEINMSALPICINIDLQRLDDSLMSIGGLSGLLELGSSMMSDTTTLTEAPTAAHRTRSVHFDMPQSPRLETAQPTRLKFNVRIGGTLISIKGKSCSVEVQSSAVKAVVRESLVGLQIDEIKLLGPVAESGQSVKPATALLHSLRLKYLPKPEEPDLTRLIALLTPSNDRFEEDDDLLLDTLVRQRRKAPVVRVNTSSVEVNVGDVELLSTLQSLAQEMAGLASMTKYLPQETRPGLMTIALLESMSIKVSNAPKLGVLQASLKDFEIAHVGGPSLMALSLGLLSIDRPGFSPMVNQVMQYDPAGTPPMLMARMLGDDLEPSIKIKLWNTCFEYNVPLALALLDLSEDSIQGNLVADMAKSIAQLPSQGYSAATSPRSSDSSQTVSSFKVPKFDFALRDCALGMTPRGLPSKILFVLTKATILGAPPRQFFTEVNVELQKAAILLVDDTGKLGGSSGYPLRYNPAADARNYDVVELCNQGYVNVSTISAAVVTVTMRNEPDRDDNFVEVGFKDELFVLETCADSTQTLIETLNALSPPAPPSKDPRYRTEITPIEDMMASFTGDAFTLDAPPAYGHFEDVEVFVDDEDEDAMDADFDDIGVLTGVGSDLDDALMEDSLYTSKHSTSTMGQTGASATLNTGGESEIIQGNILPESLPSQVQGTANKWDSSNNRYLPVSKRELAECPLRVHVQDLHAIWNLFDGYDWENTRNTITKAVQDVEAKAEEKRLARRIPSRDDKDDESVIDDFLFNSIYIGVSTNRDPRELSRQINHNIDEVISETASHTTATVTATPRPASSPRPHNRGRRLRLDRSKRHKVAFELQGLCADVFAFPPGGETQFSVDLRVQNVDVFDHVPTSTWKKFATYMQDAGPREERKPMLHVEVCNVRPVPELAATELVLRVTVLPVRLHVDQDTLDFVTRFFEFKSDTSASGAEPAEQAYLQRVEVRAVPLKLDYKPKKVDFAGLRSGRTTEFMNFFNLTGADMVLRHTIVYACSGFDKLHKSLEDVWMPDIRKNQLPGVLSGLNGVRTLVNVGSGVRDLVVVPVREYQKDGRIVRSISKGAMAFAKTTGSELAQLGARLAIGAQTVLQGAEDYLVKPSPPTEAAWDDLGADPQERRAISHFADQPAGILQGLRGAARSLERDLLVTRDVIIAVSGEVRDSSSAEGAARAVARHAPTLILRPMIGASKAISQTLMGATNSVDPENRRRIEDKYKRY